MYPCDRQEERALAVNEGPPATLIGDNESFYTPALQGDPGAVPKTYSTVSPRARQAVDRNLTSRSR